MPVNLYNVLKVRFLHSHLAVSPENLDAVCDEQGESLLAGY